MQPEHNRQNPTHLYLTLALAVYLCLVTLPATEGFMAYDHASKPHLRRKANNLIRRVHKAEWVIGYRYKDNCPPAARNNGAAIEEAITKSLNAWLQPVREMNTGKPVVADFRYVPDYKIEDVAEIKLYDLRIAFFCDFDKSVALVVAAEARPPSIHMHRGTRVGDQFAYVLLHEIGHAFGLLDTYPRKIPGEEFQVSRGGLSRTIGHQPASVMSGLNIPSPRPTGVSQDDANGIVWLYKFYHENLPLEDCIFPDYELEKSPDGCRPKYPLIFEIKHGDEPLAISVINSDETTAINAKDGDGMTALQHAIIKAYPRLVNRLFSYEAIEVNSQDGGGLTALHYAVLQRSESAVKGLLAHEDIEVNSQDGNGLTALHHAVLQRFGGGVKALLTHEDIDIEVKDGQGRTALELATELNYKEIANLISPPPPIKEAEQMSVRPTNKLATVWGALKAK